jgi:hypothetical protein
MSIASWNVVILRTDHVHLVSLRLGLSTDRVATVVVWQVMCASQVLVKVGLLSDLHRRNGD